MIGGRNRKFDLIFNMFNLDRYNVPPQWILDCLNHARGVYAGDEKRALLRTFNPLWWIKKALVTVIHIPIALFRVAGFNTTGFENSIVGKLLKLIVGTVSLAAAALVTVNLLGGLDWLKALLGIDASFWQ